MDSKIINTRLGPIEYVSVGKGIPIIFIHGGHSNCHETLSHKGFNLDYYQLITPSRPGYGKTPLKGNQSPKQAADLIMELVYHLSLDQVIIYGISAGGLTAIELASNYPQRVKKLILASAISKKWLDPKGDLYKTAQKMFNPYVETIVWGMVKFFSRIFPNVIAKNFYPQFSNKPDHPLLKNDISELVSTMKHYNSKSGFLNDIDQDIQDKTITKIRCPTLIIHSKNDSSVSLDHPYHAHQNIDNSIIEIFDNEWGHLFWIGVDSDQPIQKTIRFIHHDTSYPSYNQTST